MRVEHDLNIKKYELRSVKAEFGKFATCFPGCLESQVVESIAHCLLTVSYHCPANPILSNTPNKADLHVDDK